MQRARPLLGTLVTVRVDEAPDPACAIEAAFAAVSRVERLMSCHDRDSDLSRLNRAVHRSPMRVDPWTYSVFRLALALFHESAGAFDCAIGGRQAAAGRLPLHGEKYPAQDRSSEDIDLSIPGEVRYRRNLHVDLGGIAKGFAVDRAVDALRRAGSAAGIVNAGGDLRAFGAVSEPVHLRLPLNRGLVSIGEIRDAAVATSSTERNPPLGLPLLDGRSGSHPAARVVSVFATQCALADGLTKIVALRGPRCRAVLRRYRAAAICLDQVSGRWSRYGTANS